VAAPRMTEVGHGFLPDGLERLRRKSLSKGCSMTPENPGFFAIIHPASISYFFVPAGPAALL
jgi:hypothetical protein